jgi:alpha-mannosidase
MSALKSPFIIEGARNVFLETVKRGEYDAFDDPVNFEHKDATSTIILRLYEAYGGHAQVKLVISEHLPVLQVFTTNLLEDDVEGLYILRADGNGNNNGSYGGSVSLSFRGFEVKTIKLVLGTLPPSASHKKVLVPFSFG